MGRLYRTVLSGAPLVVRVGYSDTWLKGGERLTGYFGRSEPLPTALGRVDNGSLALEVHVKWILVIVDGSCMLMMS